jgi:hypothetical protein
LNRIAAVLLLAAALVWGAQTVRKAERAGGNDLSGYLAASHALYSGGDPYHLPGPFPYIYPLFLATVIKPLAAVPLRAASVIWFVLQAACLVFVLGGARLRLRRVALTGAAAMAVLVAIFGDVLQIELLNGQVNLIVVALVVAAVLANAAVVAGLLLGAAIALKLTPAFLFVYFVVQRRYTAALIAVASAAAFVLLPWLIVGDRLWTLYDGYLHEFVLARAQSVDIGAIFFSVRGFWVWFAGGGPTPVFGVILSLLVVAAVVLGHFRLKAEATRHMSFVYLAATPLLSPMSEVHHLTALLPLAALAGSRAHNLPVLVPFAAFVVLLWIGRLDRVGPWYFFAVVALIVAGWMALQQNPKEDA